MPDPDTLSGLDAHILSVFIAAGAEPSRLAHWIHDNTDTEAPIAALIRAGRALQAQQVSVPQL